MIRTTSGDDVIATDKTSKTFIAISWLDIEKRVCKSFNSFSQAQKYIRLYILYIYIRMSRLSFSPNKDLSLGEKIKLPFFVQSYRLSGIKLPFFQKMNLKRYKVTVFGWKLPFSVQKRKNKKITSKLGLGCS